MGVTYEDIVRFEIRMQYIALAQEAESKKHLLCVGSDGSQVDADVTPKLLQHFAEIDTVFYL